MDWHGCRFIGYVIDFRKSFHLNFVVNLLGAHTLGHVHLAASGYGFVGVNSAGVANVGVNSWDSTPEAFDNRYFTDTTGVVSLASLRSLSLLLKWAFDDADC
jgi:hypothetical protein